MEQSLHSLSIGFVEHGGVRFNVIAGAFITQEQQSTVQNAAQVRLLLLPKHNQLRMCCLKVEILRCQQTIVELLTTQAHECTLPKLITAARASRSEAPEGKIDMAVVHTRLERIPLVNTGNIGANLGV